MREVHDYYGHPFLDEMEEAVSRIIRLLDRYGYSDQSLYIAQECLIDELLQLGGAAREYKAEAKRLRMQAANLAIEAKKDGGDIPDAVKVETKNLYEEAADYDEARRVLQYGRWLFRYVGDGIAWHAFRHSRRVIRALASKEPVPAVAEPKELDSVRRIFRAVRRLGRDWLPVLHDITNCLRTADLSVFRDGYLIRIAELKLRQSELRATSDFPRPARVDDRVRRQEQRLARIQRFLETKDLGDLDPELAGGKSLDSESAERHNFEAVSRAIAGARVKGYGFDSPESGVIYIAWDVLEDSVEGALSAAQAQHPNIVADGIAFRSISARFEDHHQGLPITAMAMSADDILDILFGRVGVVAMVNLAMLEAYCLERGTPIKVIKGQGKSFSVNVEADNFRGEVQEGLWDRLMLEALSLESFSGLIQSIMASHSSGEVSSSA